MADLFDFMTEIMDTTWHLQKTPTMGENCDYLMEALTIK